MTSFEHRQLVRRIQEADSRPDSAEAYREWLNASQHLDLLRGHDRQKEILVHALTPHSLVYSLIVDESRVMPIDVSDLLQWGESLYSVRSAYYVGDSKKLSISRESDWSCRTLDDSKPLLYAREYNDKTYLEVLQEYVHLSNAYWFEDQESYCRYDRLGDIEQIVSLQNQPDIASALMAPLSQYLAASDSVLIRVFEFRMFKEVSLGNMSVERSEYREDNSLFYYHDIYDSGEMSIARGAQVIFPAITQNDAYQAIFESSAEDEQTSIDFIGHDGEVAQFNLEPVFFRPEVLHKYKADKEKYTIDRGMISCRGGWYLRSHDVNDAGQVYAYLCDLRLLPRQEQEYWKSFNENPRAGISERSWKTDFLAQFPELDELEQLLSILTRWHESGVPWWENDPQLLRSINIPYTSSRKDWAQEFQNLSELVNAGFQTKYIRGTLDTKEIGYDRSWKSLKLLSCLTSNDLTTLKTVQRIRSTVAAHTGGKEGEGLWHDALAEHDSPAAHFLHLCRMIVEELEIIEKIFIHA